MGPVGLEVKFAVRMRKPVEIMRGAEIRLDIAPQIGLQRLDATMSAPLQRGVDQLARRHFESGMADLEPPRKRPQHLVIGAALAGRLDQLATDRNVLVAATVIE